MRIIPKKTNVKMEFFRNITIGDVILAIGLIALCIILLLSNLTIKTSLMVVLVVFSGFLYMKFDGYRVYSQIGSAIRFLIYRRKFYEGEKSDADVARIVPFVAVGNGVIDYHDYCAGVIEIQPNEFRLLSEYRQNLLIDNVYASIIRSVSGSMKASLIKLDRPFILDSYIEDEEKKKEALDNVAASGELTPQELKIRKNIIENRENILKSINKEDKVYRPCFYMAFYDSDKSAVDEILNYSVKMLGDNGMSSHILNDKELALFLKYNYTNDVEETEIEKVRPADYASWARPHSVEFTPTKTIIDGVSCYTYTIKDYPISVYNAWGYKLFNINDTKVVMNLTPIPKSIAVKRINRAVDEIVSQSRNKSRASDIVDQETHLQTMMSLLTYLQNGNETLFEVTLHVTIFDRHPAGENESSGLGATENIRKRVRRIITEDGFKINENFAKQLQAFVSTSPSALDLLGDTARSIHSGSIAAAFPFVLNAVVDPRGVLLGASNDFPVIIDFFMRDKERVNSNMTIIGKSGSGKSFSTKTMLTNLAAENTKIFILDPENEYSELTKNLGGKMIDVGTAREGRLNPFQIVTSLDDDEAESAGEGKSNFYVHLQFLEEFFKQILVGIESDPLEYLNNLVIKMYAQKGINATTDLSTLTPADYPIFDDLLRIVEEASANAADDYSIRNSRTLLNYIGKFAGEGRNSNLWNGESSINVDENFVVFNFQTLLANKNNTVANAQMLLVLKWLDNEIIKNRDFNTKHHTDRKIIVAIDEAHVFIDAKYPIALDFMYQLAKRIRKYNGMQIIITQNVKDFVGSPELIRKSTAIINACQYSFIFALAPNDMDDLCKLYEKAGAINPVEQEEIINNARGSAFVITSPLNRANMDIIASSYVQNLFEHII